MAEIFDGVYKSRVGSHLEKLIQIPVTSKQYYQRFVDEDTGIIRLVPVG